MNVSWTENVVLWIFFRINLRHIKRFTDVYLLFSEFDSKPDVQNNPFWVVESRRKKIWNIFILNFGIFFLQFSLNIYMIW